MKNKTVIGVTGLLLAGLSSSALLAEKVQYQVEQFSSFSVGTGMLAKVSCGSSYQATLLGSEQDLAKVKVVVDAGHLEIERSTSGIFSNMFGNNDNSDNIKVDIQVAGPLHLIQGSTGSSLTVDACAIDGNQLTVEGGTGASINVAGTTSQLDLDLSTGGEFNRRNSDQLSVAIANIDLSTGATAYLCQAQKVTGSGSTGATVFTNENADTSEVSMSFGAEVVKSRCK